MRNLVYLFFFGLFSNSYSIDVIFMVDSSKSILGYDICDYSELIQNFTSALLLEALLSELPLLAGERPGLLRWTLPSEGDTATR